MNEPTAEPSFGVAFGRLMLLVGVISAILGAVGFTGFWMLAGYVHLIALVLFITDRRPGGKRQTVEATETKATETEVPPLKIPPLVPPKIPRLWGQK